MDEPSCREGAMQERDDKRVPWRFLGKAEVAVSVDAHQPAVRRPVKPLCSLEGPRLPVHEAGRRFRGYRLKMVRHHRQRPDTVAQKRRP
jgi:hypothetical protein